MRTRFVFAALLALAFTLTWTGAALAAPDAKSDRDVRKGVVQPNATQLSIVQNLGATARWNQFGTPSSLIKYGGYLATGVEGSKPAAGARTFIDANKALFRLTSLSNLEVYNEADLVGSDGYAVTFRQVFGGFKAAEAGLITVGLDGKSGSWNVAYVSSTATASNQTLAAQPTKTAQEAWLAAALDVGYGVADLAPGSPTQEGGWTEFPVAGFEYPQRARPVAIPTPRNGVRPGWEVLVVDDIGGMAIGYHSFVDAATGAIWLRKNITEQSHPPTDAESGEITETPQLECGPYHGPWDVTASETVGLVTASVTANNPNNDTILILYRDPDFAPQPEPGDEVAQEDFPSPALTGEVLVYDPADSGVGRYWIKVCEFANFVDVPALPDYEVTIEFSPEDAEVPYPPKWQVVPANPLLGLSMFPWNMPDTDIREIWCWESTIGGPPPIVLPECDREVQNLASRLPWDVDPFTNTPTFTTQGNNASTSEAWENPLAPGRGYRPVDNNREYIFTWDNEWFNDNCNPASLEPGVVGTGMGEPDLAAAITNLFVQHNRVHDWQYFLGFTERHWNGQESNFGQPTAQGDPVLGDAQAGALDGAFPFYLGRDNANMRPLPDGQPPITNMYLWQPIAGSFYPPCVDGDFDNAVIVHEYTHLTENRMIGKGGTRGGAHAGAMGESVADFNAAEYLNEMGFVPVSGEDPFAVGAYATGNHRKGIRNFNMSWPTAGDMPRPGVTPEINPLNFSDVGYDFVGPQVHADGEMWSKTQFRIRELLIDKYNAQYPATDAALQRRCGEGDTSVEPPSPPLPADQCPGNRRWIQLYFDAMLLMPTGPSFVDARDAELAADQLRFGGANQTELWRAFGGQGLGDNAFSNGNSDTQPIPSFESRVENNEATVTFTVRERQTATKFRPINTAKIFVGWYEFDATPIADTDPATPTAAPPAGVENNQDNVAQFVPGTYEFVVQAPRFGHQRFRLTLGAGQNRNVVITLSPNFASKNLGSTASGDGAPLSLPELIDDTEGTNWDCGSAVVIFNAAGVPIGVTSNPCKPTNAPSLNLVEGAQVTVDLHGTAAQPIRQVNVSAMLRGQNRFTALREFEILFCNANVAPNCTDAANFTVVLTSGADAFPAVSPRPSSNDTIVRSWTIPGTLKKATHVRIRVVDNQCTGQTQFQDPGNPTTTDQDSDPTNETDCRLGNPATATVFGDELPQQVAPRNGEVHIAELQVFAVAPTVTG